MMSDYAGIFSIVRNYNKIIAMESAALRESEKLFGTKWKYQNYRNLVGWVGKLLKRHCLESACKF